MGKKKVFTGVALALALTGCATNVEVEWNMREIIKKEHSGCENQAQCAEEVVAFYRMIKNSKIEPVAGIVSGSDHQAYKGARLLHELHKNNKKIVKELDECKEQSK